MKKSDLDGTIKSDINNNWWPGEKYEVAMKKWEEVFAVASLETVTPKIKKGKRGLFGKLF